MQVEQPKGPDQRSLATSGRAVASLLLVWLLVALVIGASGRLAALRPPIPQVVIVVLTAGSLAAALLVPRFRAWADSVSIRLLVALHLSRFVGAYFLSLAHRGLLPPRFAIPAGWGDLVVAFLALCLLISGVRPENRTGSRFYFAWNALGMIDILFVVGNAARIGIANPTSMQPLLHLPLSLLPTFLVPIIITSHVLLFRRFRMV